MTAMGARVFAKSGAEGVYCAALPDFGLGIAVKCDDGAGRAAEVATATLIARFLPNNGDVAPDLAALAAPVMRNWNGIHVGGLRATGALA
jgi:L-asparaginase II